MSAATAAAAAAASPHSTSSPATSEDTFRFQEYEGVQFRNPQYSNQPTKQQRTVTTATNGSPDMSKRKSDQIHTKKAPPRDLPNNIYANTQTLVASEEEVEEPDPIGTDEEVDLRTATEENPRRRKFHAKSFSLSENQILAGTNLFQHNRELWEKRSELQSQQSLTTPRILSRNRIAPDLVMDLPFQDDDEGVLSAIEQRPAPGDAELAGLDTSSMDSIDQLTSAERFAAANQCTLKKNERFSGDGCEGIMASAARIEANTVEEHHHSDMTDGGGELGTMDNVLRIEEQEVVRKSPIPTKNTQKFVTKFADLHLTGGCLTASVDSVSAAASSLAAGVTSNGGASASVPSSATSGNAFSSFKPAVKIKPPLLKKPLVIPPGTPEMTRRHDD